jgi:serine/threonine protein kinase
MYGKVNDKTDVYSFGVVLLELITGRTPIDTSRPKGQENLVTWASPLLEERNLEKLVDPQLKAVGMYDLNEMESMVLAASLCVQQSAPRRPSMSQV